jgi:hypothetical protein
MVTGVAQLVFSLQDFVEDLRRSYLLDHTDRVPAATSGCHGDSLVSE